jgi:hypothetical protein
VVSCSIGSTHNFHASTNVAPVEERQVPPTLSEAAPQPADEPAISPVHEPAPPRDLGRGGAQHRAIQERLQTEVLKLGFLAEVEKQLNKGSNQAADLVLRHGELAIAVEIAVTTSTDHEFQNIQKCLAAGFERVAVISTSVKRLEGISAAVQGGLGPDAATKVN